jgi:hypothetical protein
MTDEGGRRLTTADLAAASSEAHERREATAEPQDGRRSALFAPDEAQSMRTRWNDVQTGFVDEPRHAVEQADGLVADAIRRLAEVFADERRKLEEEWDRGGDVSTEDLRVALQRYRSFFDRLLAI